MVPPKERTNTSGQFHVGVHRIVYCWYNRIIPEGMVIDHINSDKLDNRLENLRLYTPKENIAKERPESTRELKCKLNKPRVYYEDKLAQYEALYEAAKNEHNAGEAHKQRTNIAQTKARLRYYDNHIHEVDALKAEAKTKQKEKKQMTEFKKDLMELKYWKERFKEAGNKTMWHECCKVEKLAKTASKKEVTFILQHALDTLHGKFGGM